MASINRSAPWEAFSIPRAAPAKTNIARLLRQEGVQLFSLTQDMIDILIFSETTDVKNRKDIQLRNVPLSATPADIRRFTRAIRMEDVTSGVFSSPSNTRNSGLKIYQCN